jgi:hypothetical protein
MRKIVRALFPALVLFVIAGVAAQAGQAKVDVTGTWAFEVTTAQGAGTPTVTFKQDGEKLTGHYSSGTLGEADLTGTVKGSDISFTFTADLQGQSAPVSFTGTIESATAMKGSLDIASMLTGTFTGKKK